MFYTAADNGLISFAAEPVEKPDARFICVRLGIVTRQWKVNVFHESIGMHSVREVSSRLRHPRGNSVYVAGSIR